MTTEPTASGNGRSRTRPPRDAAAGGGPPVTGNHLDGDAEGTIERAFLRAGGLVGDLLELATLMEHKALQHI